MRVRTKVVVGLGVLVLTLLIVVAALVLWFLLDGPIEGWQEEPAAAVMHVSLPRPLPGRSIAASAH